MKFTTVVRGVFADMNGGPKPGESFEETMFRLMLEQKQAGNKIVLGFDVPLLAGQIVLKMDCGEAIVRARSTRDQYLMQAAPGSDPRGFERSAFYYEVELIESAVPMQVAH